MCNYKSGFYLDDLEFYWKLRAMVVADLKPLYQPHYYENTFDHLLSPVMTKPGELAGLFSWGLIPPFAKSLDHASIIRKGTVNTKSEEMWEKDSFIPSLEANQRCLIPANGFFEWQ